MNPRAVAALIIGNEVLTAKVEEANGAYVIRRFRDRGVELHSMHIVRDDVDDIVEQLHACRRHARFVITSGGVGPTHDDVTIRAVALTLQRDVVILPEMEARIRGFYGERDVPAAALRMAEGPAGSTLIPTADLRFPVLECDGIFMLPGVPQLFKAQLETVLTQLPGTPVSLRQLFLNQGESEIAKALDDVALRFPHVAIGSYPTWGEAEYRVKLTVEHVDPAETQKVFDALKAVIAPSAIVRVD